MTLPVLRLEFDARGDGARRARYFHFLWGFLLPAIERAQALPDTRIEFGSCGPTMDRVALDTFAALGIDATLAPEAGATPVEHLPRLDALLLAHAYLRHAPRLFLRMVRRGVWRGRPGPSTLWRVVDHNRACFAALEVPAANYRGKVLLLERAPPEDYYTGGEGVRSRGYGAERRAIANDDALEAELQRRGLAVERFEAGSRSLVEQARAFASCSAIVGIRGAEFANVLWLNPGASVVVFDPPELPGRTPTRRLAERLGVRWHELPIATAQLSREAISTAADRLARDLRQVP